MAVHAFDDLIEAIVTAVNHARQVGELQHMQILNRFFEQDKETKQLRAKTVDIHVPSLKHGVDEHEPIEVPLVTLVPMTSLSLSDITVEFQAHLSGLESDEEKGKKRVHLALKGSGLFKSHNEATIKITLKATDPPEGLVRVNERIIKQLP